MRPQAECAGEGVGSRSVPQQDLKLNRMVVNGMNDLKAVIPLLPTQPHAPS